MINENDTVATAEIRFQALKKILDERGAGAASPEAGADAELISCLDDIGALIKQAAERLKPAADSPATRFARTRP